MNINPEIPLVGQKQRLVMQAIAEITPELQQKLGDWCEKVGLPPNEVGNTIFRLGLIGFSIHVADADPIDEEKSMHWIPLTENEKRLGQG
jgi:hypothetical protein